MEFSIQSRLGRWLGYSVFFIVLFFFFLMWTFPVDRFQVTLERFMSGALGRDVTMEDLDMSMTGAVVLTGVRIAVDSENEDDRRQLSTRSPDEDDDDDDDDDDEESGKTVPALPKKLSYYIDEAVVDVGVLGLLFKRLDAELDIEAFDGTLSISYDGPIPEGDSRRPPRRRRPRPRPDAEDDGDDEDDDQDESEGSPLAISVVAEDISIARVYGLKSLLPVPISGVLNFEMDLESESGLLAESSGSMELELEDLMLSKKGYEADVMDMKMKVPPLEVASLASEIAIQDGTGEVSDFKVKSKHFDASVEGSISLHDPISKSRLDLYLKFRVLAAYINQSESLKTIMPTIDMVSSKMKRAHRDDDYYGFRYQGQLGSGRFLPQKEYIRPGSKRGKSRSPRRSRSRTRRPTPSSPSRAPSAFTGGGGSPVPITPPDSPGTGEPRGRPEFPPSPAFRGSDSDDGLQPPVRSPRGRMEMPEPREGPEQPGDPDEESGHDEGDSDGQEEPENESGGEVGSEEDDEE